MKAYAYKRHNDKDACKKETISVYTNKANVETTLKQDIEKFHLDWNQIPADEPEQSEERTTNTMHKFDRKHWIERFKDHIATLTEAGPVKILDFKAPDTIVYRIRFIFEEDYCKLTITGDLGSLTATNYYNMTYEKFKDFISSPGYFIEKIDSHEHPIYAYDENQAEEELRKKFEKDFDNKEDFDEFIDEILNNFDEDDGLSESGYDTLLEHDSDAWEYATNLGKYRTNYIDLYLLAYELARKQLESKSE